MIACDLDEIIVLSSLARLIVTRFSGIKDVKEAYGPRFFINYERLSFLSMSWCITVVLESCDLIPYSISAASILRLLQLHLRSVPVSQEAEHNGLRV